MMAVCNWEMILYRWDYMESGGSLYRDMDRLAALEQGLRTWARWVDANIDASSTRVFFQSISPTHYKYVFPFFVLVIICSTTASLIATTLFLIMGTEFKGKS